MIVDTRKRFPGKRAALPMRTIRRIIWPELEVRLDMTRAEIDASPEHGDQVARRNRSNDRSLALRTETFA